MQIAAFVRHAGTSRWTFNWGLQRKIETYRGGRTATRFDLEKELVVRRRTDLPWLGDVSKCMRQEALKDLDVAFSRFYRSLRSGKKSGFPHYKKRRLTSSSFRFSGEAVKVESTRIRLARIGWVRLKEAGYLPIGGVHVVGATVSERAGRWFISVTVGREVPLAPPHRGPVVGLDVGISRLVTLSDGTMFAPPREFDRFQVRLRRAQRSMCRKKRGGANWRKSARAVARIHMRIANVRADRTHKITTELTRTKSVIVVEDFRAQALGRNRSVSRALWNAGLAELLRQLTYKAAWRGGKVQVAPMFFPSTKRCSSCGAVGPGLPLSQRTFTCAACGFVLDRDVNAARNLSQLAASPADSNACGEGIRPYLAAALYEAGTAPGGGRSSWKMTRPSDFPLLNEAYP
jgi:putative transposase